MYYYEVARIRVKELSLFQNSTIEQLIACKNYEDCLRMLKEKGFGKASATLEEMMEEEERATYQLFCELVKDEKVLRVFQIPYDFHNGKVAIKLLFAENKNLSVKEAFLERGSVPANEIRKAVKEGKFELLPEMLAIPLRSAYEDLLHTEDAQLCDALLDAACLSNLIAVGKESKVELLKKMTELKVAFANISIAFRACRAKKSSEFLGMALVPCETLSCTEIKHACLKGEEELLQYFKNTSYAKGATLCNTSYAAFEQWCDNQIMELIKEGKYLSYTVAPLIGYYMAREIEIKMIKLILAGKRNSFPDQLIRERMRKLYV